jgi:hypothetical protein
MKTKKGDVMYKIDHFNRHKILLEYIDAILNSKSDSELRNMSKSLLIEIKGNLSNIKLENEIMRHFPNILINTYISENHSRSLQYTGWDSGNNYILE